MGLDQGWRETFAAAARAEEHYQKVAASRKSVGFFLDSNIGGKIYFLLSASTTKAFVRNMMNASAMREQNKVLLALRLHELDHGKLPESLEALVPAYLPAVPGDLYTGKPMLWNAKSKIVYSTGENGIDDGGAIDEARVTKGLDVGKTYPWVTAPATSKASE